MRSVFPCAGEYERIFVLCLTAAKGIRILLHYNATILWKFMCIQ
jgi:hypothetical protein